MVRDAPAVKDILTKCIWRNLGKIKTMHEYLLPEQKDLQMMDSTKKKCTNPSLIQSYESIQSYISKPATTLQLVLKDANFKHLQV